MKQAPSLPHAQHPESPWKADFPALARLMNGRPLVYLDSAASAQKPDSVIQSMESVMRTGYANIHRGLYRLSQDLTVHVEQVREKVAHFIGASSPQSIIFTRNATEGINLVAQSWGRTFLRAGDEILLTEMEHHANIVPWQMLRDQVGIVIKVLPITEDGYLDFQALPALITPRTKLFSFVQISNVLGTINDAKALIAAARAIHPDIKILIDGAQSAVHGSVSVKDLGCDFFVFTAHKLYGPTGLGALYVRPEILADMPPYQGGGDMIETVTFQKTTYKSGAARFEAGTPAIVQIVGLGAAIDYMQSAGLAEIHKHEDRLTRYAWTQLSAVPGLKIFGPMEARAPILAFTLSECHHADVAMILDQQGIAVRAGHHCCMPLQARLGVMGTVRASFGLYNAMEDVDALVSGLHKAWDLLT